MTLYTNATHAPQLAGPALCLTNQFWRCPGNPAGPFTEHGNPTHDPASFSAQSTFILRNPAFTAADNKKSKLAPFIYAADRWQTNTTDFGKYLWLPLFVDPAGRPNTSVSVVNPASWKYDEPLLG
eukprot:SAG22_NODE_2989_length_2045_cov_2.700411_3_plen_125_part_00